MLALLLLAGAAAVTADEAMTAGRAMMRATPPACAQEGGEIVVCGRRDEGARQRLPLSDERGPAEGRRFATGERPPGDATPVRQAGCGVIDRGQVCGGGLSIFSLAEGVSRIVRTLADPDGIAEPDDFRKRPGYRKPHPPTPLAPR